MITAPPVHVLPLDEEERAALYQLLEQALAEMHAEKRRTESPSYRQELQHQEVLIQSLAEKMRHLGDQEPA